MPARDPGSAATPSPAVATGEGPRRYRQTKKYQGPPWWRTRADPFAEVWAVIEERLAADPTRTAKELCREVQAEYPGRVPDGQLRTLQRRVQQWRATTILTFHDTWLAEDRLAGPMMPPFIRGQLDTGVALGDHVVQTEALLVSAGS
jgi:hypothetical protein